VCDNAGAWRYFSPEEVPVSEDPDVFLELCEDVLRNIRAREEMARNAQIKVRQQYTYLHTVVQLLTEIDAGTRTKL
jgi:spore maturation protein CgeB